MYARSCLDRYNSSFEISISSSISISENNLLLKSEKSIVGFVTLSADIKISYIS